MNLSQNYTRYCPFGYDLTGTNIRVNPFNTEFFLSKPSLIVTLGRCAVAHRGNVTGHNVVCDFAATWGLRGPAGTQAELGNGNSELYVPGALPISVMGADGGNILNHAHHYGQLNFSSSKLVSVPGWYRLEVYMHSRSDAAPPDVGLSEINIEAVPLNELITLIFD